MKLLLIMTDNAGAIPLGKPLRLRPPVGPGDSTTLEYTIQSAPMLFARLLIGPDPRVRSVTPSGIRPLGTPGDATAAWRVDEVKIDGEVRIRADDDQAWGVGRVVAMRVTNLGAAPAHFYATWEMEDVH